MIKIKPENNSSGFALIITILVLTVVVSVTLSIIELSIQQINLSVDSKDSEIAFHAANAGLECATYYRKLDANKFETGQPVEFDCFSVNSSAVEPQVLDPGIVYLYKDDVSWGTSPAERCSEITILSIVSSTTPVTVSGMENTFAGYEGSVKTCNPGGICTVISVSGYSSNCANKNTQGTLKREILLEL